MRISGTKSYKISLALIWSCDNKKKSKNKIIVLYGNLFECIVQPGI